MSHGSRTQASLVGEDAALDAPGDDQHHGANCTAGDTGGRESASEDVAEDCGPVGNVCEANDQASHDVDNSHDGDQLLSNRTQTLDAAQQDDGCQDCQDDTQNQVDGGLTSEVGVEGGNHGVDGAGDVTNLNSVADAEGCQCAEDTEDGAQPLPVLAQAVLDVVHGAADPVAQCVSLTELDGQQNLGVLGTHTDQSGDPQPEDGAGAAQGDSCGNTGDVTGTDGSCQSGGHSLEGSDFALTGVGLLENLTDGVLQSIAKLTELDACGTAGQQDACAHQQDQHGRTPHEAIDRAVDTSD